MKAKTKKTLVFIGVALAAGGAYWYFSKPAQAITPNVNPSLPPGNSPGNSNPAPGNNPVYVPPVSTPPIVSTPLKIGDTVKTTAIVHGYNGSGLIGNYSVGGSPSNIQVYDNTGFLGTGMYAGTITDIQGYAAKVSNYTYPMKIWGDHGNTINVYDYWLPLNKLIKA